MEKLTMDFFSIKLTTCANYCKNIYELACSIFWMLTVMTQNPRAKKCDTKHNRETNIHDLSYLPLHLRKDPVMMQLPTSN